MRFIIDPGSWDEKQVLLDSDGSIQWIGGDDDWSDDRFVGRYAEALQHCRDLARESGGVEIGTPANGGDDA